MFLDHRAAGAGAGPRTSTPVIAQRAWVSADREAWRDVRSRDSHLRIIRDYVKRQRPGGLHNPLLSDGGGGGWTSGERILVSFTIYKPTH